MLARSPERDCSLLSQMGYLIPSVTFLKTVFSSLIPHRGLGTSLLTEPGSPPLISGSQEKKSISYPEVWEPTAQLGQLMGSRVPPTFIRHKLASILSCSTILRACPILIVLFTGVSPFILKKREGQLSMIEGPAQSQLKAPLHIHSSKTFTRLDHVPRCFPLFIPIFQCGLSHPCLPQLRKWRGWDEMLPRLPYGLGHRSSYVQMM